MGARSVSSAVGIFLSEFIEILSVSLQVITSGVMC